ncbi:MAG: sporulation integral membrane protein YtvI [Oscillospiraceae bacterium]
MPYEKRKKFIVDVTYYSLIAAMFFLGLKYGLEWLLPFIIAFGVAMIMRPLAKKISMAFRVNEKIAACFCSIIFYGITLFLIIFASFNLFALLKNLFFGLPTLYTSEIEPAIVHVLDSIQNALITLDPALEGAVEDFTIRISANLGASISSISMSAIAAMSGVVTKVPSYFIKTLIMVIATFFISTDYENITVFILRQLSPKWQIMLLDIKEYTGSTLIKYLKSYIFIIFITFSELTAAFLLLKVNNAVTLAFIISIFDVLPVLGVGGFLIPWGIISLLQGRYAFGAAMLIVYLIITVIRQILEPKIIGEQVGLHPVATLVAMFLGARFFGVIGLFLFPISLVILKKLNDAGKIHLFR